MIFQQYIKNNFFLFFTLLFMWVCFPRITARIGIGVFNTKIPFVLSFGKNFPRNRFESRQKLQHIDNFFEKRPIRNQYVDFEWGVNKNKSIIWLFLYYKKIYTGCEHLGRV